MKRGPTTQRRGRPRGGVRPGERLRDYPTLTVRVPPDTRAMLKALCARRRRPTWVVLRQLVVCFVRGLPPRDRQWIVRQARASAC